jgi:hypothetical protein
VGAGAVSAGVDGEERLAKEARHLGMAVQIAAGHFAVEDLLGGVDHVANRADGDGIRPIWRGIQFLQSGFDELSDRSGVHYETEGRTETLEAGFPKGLKIGEMPTFQRNKIFRDGVNDVWPPKGVAGSRRLYRRGIRELLLCYALWGGLPLISASRTAHPGGVVEPGLRAQFVA